MQRYKCTGTIFVILKAITNASSCHLCIEVKLTRFTLASDWIYMQSSLVSL